MNVKTRNFLAWSALGLSLAATGWVMYDIYLRYPMLVNDDQVLHFTETTIGAQVSEAISLNEVINAHLFGVQPVAVKKVVEQPKVINAPKTRLNLKLTGLVASSSEEYGFAMIEIKRGETSVVGVGKEIGKTGARLHAIESDHILIDHRGKIEKLQLERDVLKVGEPDSISSETIKQLNLTESELATLTQIGESSSEGAEQFPQEILLNPVKVMDEGQIMDEGLQEPVESEGDEAPVLPAG
jgi:general secretion pathway protein C